MSWKSGLYLFDEMITKAIIASDHIDDNKTRDEFLERFVIELSKSFKKRDFDSYADSSYYEDFYNVFERVW
jgi:hypothetical protein